MGFNKPPRVFLRDDPQNAQNPLGKTAYYDPEQMSVTLYIVSSIETQKWERVMLKETPIYAKWSGRLTSKAIYAFETGKIA
jgi:hypothetical protein